MVIHEITAEAVLAQCRKTVGLPSTSEFEIDDALIAGLLRRAAGYLSPCSGAALRAALLDSLQKLTDGVDLADRIDEAINWLVIGGDLLELQNVTTSDPSAKGTWVYPAPPSFIMRPAGSYFLTGTVPDQDTFLPLSLASRIMHEGFIRVLQAAPDEDLAKELKEYGLQQLAETVWLKAPREEAYDVMLASYKQMLDSQEPSGEIADLTVIDPASSVRFYKGRWTSPKARHSGMFVGRRPQEFGAFIWGLVELQNGRPIRFLDLPKKQRPRWRGNDEAWLVQMAIDRASGNPQRFRRQQQGVQVRFDLFSPLPSWAQRRLMILGRSVPPEKCLMSFLLPASQASEEERFLRDRLWLANIDDPI